MRVLIIEDNAAFRDSLRSLLRSRSNAMEILEACDGSDAISLVADFTPDIVFIDIQLPGPTGLSVTRTIKRHFPALPIAILTSYDLPEYRNAAYLCGANYFFGKDTIGAEEILHLVSDHLHMEPGM
ncbi:MAG TPA: response regulator transcription factor [Gammaproteobacteria bacterium]